MTKLAKILARAKSSNVHEASTARKMADDLMVKHGLTDVDLRQHVDSGYHELSLGFSGFNASWKFALVTAAARYSGCEAIALQSGRRRKVRIVGEKAAVEKAAAFFQELLEILVSLERSEGERLGADDSVDLDSGPRQCADSFRRGAVSSIVGKLMLARPARFHRKGYGSGKRGSEEGFGGQRAGESVSESSQSEKDAGGGSTSTSRAGKVWTAVKALVVGDKRAEHAEKIREKYSPRMKPIDLEDAPSVSWYWLGFDAAEHQVTIQDEETSSDGKVGMDNAKADG